MKNLFYTLLLTFFVTSCADDPFSKVNNKNVENASQRDNMPVKFPIMTFDNNTFDFGTIQNGTPVETIFTYTNTGDAPLVVSDIKPTCGCTAAPGWSKAPLLPGETAQFTIKFDGKGANKTTKTVNIKANTQNGNEVVKLTGFINNPDAVKPPQPIS